MEHIEGGYYTSPTKPCRCTACTANHAARARDYRWRVHPSQPDKLKLQIEQLQAELDQMKAWAASAPSGEKVPQ